MAVSSIVRFVCEQSVIAHGQLCAVFTPACKLATIWAFNAIKRANAIKHAFHGRCLHEQLSAVTTRPDVANATPWYGQVAYLKQDFTGNLFQDSNQF